MKGRVIQCRGFLDMQIGMEPLVIDWAKEEPKMGQMIWHLCLLLIIQFLGRLYNFFSARSIALKEFYLMLDFQKNSLYRF